MMDFHPLFIPGLMRWESYQQKAYYDKGKERPIAIGYGTREHNASGFEFTIDTVLRDEDHAMELLLADIEKQYVPQLNSLFKKINFTAPTVGYYCGFLDALYNRGYGRIENSLAYDWLKHPERPKCLATAAACLSHSRAMDSILTPSGRDDFTALDTAWSDDHQREVIYPGLCDRRAFDTTLCMMERF